MVSTPNAPGGLFERIEKEPGESCLYRRLKKDYNYGLGRIYTVEEIEKAKQSPGFGREYELQYLGRIGNVFNSSQIDKTIELGERYKGLPTNDYTLHSVGVDFGFSSSATAINEFLKEERKIRHKYIDTSPADSESRQDLLHQCERHCS